MHRSDEFSQEARRHVVADHLRVPILTAPYIRDMIVHSRSGSMPFWTILLTLYSARSSKPAALYARSTECRSRGNATYRRRPCFSPIIHACSFCWHARASMAMLCGFELGLRTAPFFLETVALLSRSHLPLHMPSGVCCR